MVKPPGLFLCICSGKLPRGQLNTKLESSKNAPHMIGVVSNPKQLLDQVRREKSRPNTRVQTYALWSFLYDVIKLCKQCFGQFRFPSPVRSLYQCFDSAPSIPENPVLQGSSPDSQNLGCPAFRHALTYQEQPLNALRQVEILASPCNLQLPIQFLHLALTHPKTRPRHPTTSPKRSMREVRGTDLWVCRVL